MYGVINFREIDTTPGGKSAFSPPADFAGNYKAYLIERMRTDRGVYQHVATVARMFRPGATPPNFHGPYAVIASELIQKIWGRMVASAKAEKAKRKSMETSP